MSWVTGPRRVRVRVRRRKKRVYVGEKNRAGEGSIQRTLVRVQDGVTLKFLALGLNIQALGIY